MQPSTSQPALASGTFAIGGDLKVFRMGFGAMRITGPGIWGLPTDKPEAIAVLHRTLQLGINFIDTADSYGPNVSEELIAEALYPYPKDLVIGTKGGLLRPSQQGPWPRDGRPQHLREALEGSLKRLRVEQIDLYQYHRPDPEVPFEDSVGELARMKQEGKIKHVGLSNVTLDELARAQKIVPIVSVQNRFGLGQRDSERMSAEDSSEMIDTCARQGIAFIPWGPLNLSNLADGGRALDEAAKNHSATRNQIVLAWLLQRSSSMLPIPGTSSVRHLEENTAAAEIKLSQQEFDAIKA